MGVELKFIQKLPYFIQDLIITLYNFNSYRKRRGGKYNFYKYYYSSLDDMCMVEGWEKIQEEKLRNFLDYATTHSKWYSRYKGLDLKEFPVLTKADIMNNLNVITTLPDGTGEVCMTGGTTGASMKVVYRASDIQERHALLDSFRERFGYKLGRKTAWFSGKDIASDRDVKNGRCYRDDLFHKIRFYSTFHITEENFDSYWSALEEFSPEFIVGFPSSLFHLCEIAKNKGFKIENSVKVFYPTAETILDYQRDVITSVLGCRIFDQYASSEGAPFILECEEGKLHMHPLTGVFEVVNENYEPANEGQILVTSFTTLGTPLIRYRIGDIIKRSTDDLTCPCGSTFPLVDRIDGRETDYVYSPENGKINLVNFGNATKGIIGISCYQIIQESFESIDVNVVALPTFDQSQERKFLVALKDRVGPKMNIKIKKVNNIPPEPSGKFRIVKNRVGSK